MKKDLEEITIHDVNRIGKKLVENQFTAIKQLTNTIEMYNAFIKETDSYSIDHIVKYYMDRKTGDLTYSITKKGKIGF